MNPRIIDIIEESRDFVQTQTKVGGGMYVPGPMVRGDVNLHRFAELIIRECMDVVRDINQEYDGGSTVVNAANEIKQHFGV